MLAGVGIGGTSALCLSLIAFAASVAWSLIGGFVYLGLKKRENLTEVTSSSENDPSVSTAD
jgi:hypothetical protein